MKLDHIAIWASDIDALKEFYVRYFDGKAGEKFSIKDNGFSSYFVEFETGSRLELMSMPGIPDSQDDPIRQFSGLIHLAFDLPDSDAVTSKTETLRQDGYTIVEEPHPTPDGYFESTVLDPSGVRVEIGATL